MKASLIGGPRDGEEIICHDVRFVEFPLPGTVWRCDNDGNEWMGFRCGVYERIAKHEYEWRGER